MAAQEKATVFTWLRLFKGQKERRMARLLALLAEEPAVYRTVGDLARLSGLGNVVYPLLADLSRQGLVEHHWALVEEETRLVYRLTPKGLDLLG